MKKLFLLIAMCCLASGAFAQSELYKKFADMDGVDAVYIPNISTLASLGGKQTAQLNNISGMPYNIKSLKQLVVLSSEKKEVVEKLRSEMKAFLNKIGSDSAYELMLDSKSDGERTTIYMKKSRDGEMIIINDEGSEYQIVQIMGDFVEATKPGG